MICAMCVVCAGEPRFICALFEAWDRDLRFPDLLGVPPHRAVAFDRCGRLKLTGTFSSTSRRPCVFLSSVTSSEGHSSR